MELPGTLASRVGLQRIMLKPIKLLAIIYNPHNRMHLAIRGFTFANDLAIVINGKSATIFATQCPQVAQSVLGMPYKGISVALRRLTKAD